MHEAWWVDAVWTCNKGRFPGIIAATTWDWDVGSIHTRFRLSGCIGVRGTKCFTQNQRIDGNREDHKNLKFWKEIQTIFNVHVTFENPSPGLKDHS